MNTRALPVWPSNSVSSQISTAQFSVLARHGGAHPITTAPPRPSVRREAAAFW